jgi:hypothetical protein
MIKRYIFTLGGFLLLAVIYLFTLVPLLVVRADLASQTYMRALIVWGILVLISLGPALSLLIKKIWFFQGKGRAITMKKLRASLLAVNDMNVPVRVKKKGRRLLAEWRYDDPEWCERMAAEKVSRLYELCLRFNENTNTVTLSDHSRRVNFALCPIRIKTGFFSLPRLFFNIKIKKGSQLEPYSNLLPVDYRFKAAEIKSPMVNTILGQGWNVQFSLL